MKAMKLTGISNTGLMVISVLVALLWGVIAVERSYLNMAQEEYHKYLRSLPAKPAKIHPDPPDRFVPEGCPRDLSMS